MQSIDFLPQRYRDASAQRKRKLWSVVVVVVYAGLLCTSGSLQRGRQTSLRRELAAAQQQQTLVMGHQTRLAAIQADLKQAEARANLIAYLRHPWPRTQILAAVVTPLGEGLSLDELHIERQEGVRAARPRIAPANPAEAKPDNRAAAQRDLESLRDACDASPVVVTIKGSAEDVSLVHMYLGRLGTDAIFSRVDLMNIDGQDPRQQRSAACRFTARVVVRPGYGQPHGPSPIAAVTQAGKPGGGP